MSHFVDKWHEVWNGRAMVGPLEGSVLQRLISIDGFDSPLGLMTEGDWADYVALLADRAGIRQGESIFEVGCGSGAFLYPLLKAGHPVGGIDYSCELVEVARSVMPDRAPFLEPTDAASCPVEPKVDVVVANHVIHYFPTLAYARTAVEHMLTKAHRVVIVSGVPDAELKGESEVARRQLLRPDEYEAKYRDLDLLYYDKGWFERVAREQGFAPRFFRHEMPGFAQKHFRFDCVMTRIDL